MKMVLIWLGTLVVALGGAFAMFKMMAGSSDKSAAEVAAEKPAAHGEAEAKGGGHGAGTETRAIADLDPFIVNLADSPEVRYLKVTLMGKVATHLAARIAAEFRPESGCPLQSDRDVRRGRSERPTGRVSATPRPLRSNSTTPASRSSTLSCCETAETVREVAAATAVIVPRSASSRSSSRRWTSM